MHFLSLPWDVHHTIREHVPASEWHCHAFFCFAGLDSYGEERWQEICESLCLSIPASMTCTYRELFLMAYVHSTRCSLPLCRMVLTPHIWYPDHHVGPAVHHYLERVHFRDYSKDSVTLKSALVHPTFACTYMVYPPTPHLNIHIFQGVVTVSVSNPAGVTMRDYCRAVLKVLDSKLSDKEYEEVDEMVWQFFWSKLPWEVRRAAYPTMGEILEAIKLDTWMYRWVLGVEGHRVDLLMGMQKNVWYFQRCKSRTLVGYRTVNLKPV